MQLYTYIILYNIAKRLPPSLLTLAWGANVFSDLEYTTTLILYKMRRRYDRSDRRWPFLWNTLLENDKSKIQKWYSANTANGGIYIHKHDIIKHRPPAKTNMIWCIHKIFTEYFKYIYIHLKLVREVDMCVCVIKVTFYIPTKNTFFYWFRYWVYIVSV